MVGWFKDEFQKHAKFGECRPADTFVGLVRHLELSAFFVRDMIMSSRIFYGYMKSIKMRADILTKNCPAPIHNLLRTAICGYDFITRNVTKL